MTVKTLITYQTYENATLRDAIQAQVYEWQRQGKTDGNVVFEKVHPDGLLVTRTWTTLADAEAYVAFVTPYNVTNIEIQQ
jgi:hypothetical protein